MSVWIPIRYATSSAILIILLDICLGVIPTLQTLVVAKFIDATQKLVMGKITYNDIAVYVVVITFLIAFVWISKSIKDLLATKMELKLRKTFRTKITEKRKNLKYYYIEDAKTWDLISRISEKPEKRLREAFINFLDFVALIIQIVGLILVFASQVWQISIIMTILIIPVFIISLRSGKENYIIKQETQKYHRRQEYLGELLINRETAQERLIFNFGRGLTKMWHRVYEKARKVELITQCKWFVRSKLGGIATTCISVVASLFLIYPTLAGKLSIGMFISFTNSLYGLVDSIVWSLTGYVEMIANNSEYMKDYANFLDLEEQDVFKKKKKNLLFNSYDINNKYLLYGTMDSILWPASQTFDDLDYMKNYTCVNELDEHKDMEEIYFESIEFKNVSFRYPNMDKYILKGFSFKFERGISYALIGINGAGKTTLVKLMIGLYDNYTGEILLNGRNIREYEKENIKQIFSVVFQDFAKYSLSLEDNIYIGYMQDNGRGYPKQIDDVIQNVGLDKKINHYQDGLKTKLGKIYKDGQELSGGQWQRIAIARAMMRDAQICILDEPTSALDPISESNLYEEFKNLASGKTMILISHRLGSTSIADQILVLANGKLQEVGTHKELIEKNGIYCEMYEKQRSWYDE